MSEEIEEFSDAEENPEGMGFMDTVKAYTEDLGAPVPPPQEYSPAPSHTSSSLSVIHSNSKSHSINASDEQERSDYMEEEGGEDYCSEDLSSTPSTPSTPSSINEFWDPIPVSNASRHCTPKASPKPPLPIPSTPTHKNEDKPPSPPQFISLLSSSSCHSSSSSSSEDEVTIIRSRALPSQPLKRKSIDSLEPRKKIHRMIKERERDREWSVRDRGVLAEAMQDGMDFNRVARMLGREVDEVFRMFTKVIAGTLLHAPKPRDRTTQTE
ncbi:hypothetical protein L873DRAFT_1817627 [Choiromyces venosus 120613-1]|uniref:Uncharacterized protein n=1 Tax=Choiromyces venosus 120613-1 TaxID=1336337 RepID=A0A3N4J7J4_9PEZI|nr:hypothetical protein L873DRAFT_1817627 [Choiromyces venosus 120613-1]